MIGLIMTACSNVPPGYVGVVVNKYGSQKGVNQDIRGVGRVWLSWNEDLFLFPTFQQNYTWTKSPHEGQPVDESITFQTKEGMDVNVDLGITYHLNSDKIATIFQKYRKGIEEITNIYLRNAVRDATVELGSKYSVSDIYGTQKSEFIAQVNQMVNSQLTDQGIVIDKVYLVGSMRLPEMVVAALNSKIEATQKAQMRQNEIQEAQAQAQKDIAQAEGQAKAKLTIARAEAEANKMKLQTLTKELIQYEAVQKWDGKLSQFSGSSVVPFINVDKQAK